MDLTSRKWGILIIFTKLKHLGQAVETTSCFCRVPQRKKNPNVSLGSSERTSLSLLTQEFLCTKGEAAVPLLSYPPSPKTNKVSDTDQAPVGTPAPAFVRAPGHNANCDQQAASLIKHKCSYSIQDRWWTLRVVFNRWLGRVGQSRPIKRGFV